MNAPALRSGALAILVVLGIFFALGYALFEARRIIAGPELTIDTPQHGSATASTRVVGAGSAQNISFLTINDLPAYIDENGKFSQTLSPSPGYAIFTVAAKDRFGRETLRHIHITVLNYCAVSVA
jgi:hypothetical protein